MVLTIWCYYFFRDPERQSINSEDYLVSPADGEVIKVEEVNGPKELGLENKKMTKITSGAPTSSCLPRRVGLLLHCRVRPLSD